MAISAEPVLSDKNLAKAVEIPTQMPQDGVADVLLELRAERLNSSLLVLTHLPQGLGKNADVAVAGFADLLHNRAYAEVLDRSSYRYEQDLNALGEAFTSGKPLPKRGDRNWENVFASIATYSLSHPSGQYVSVLFRQDTTGGAAHSNWSYSAVSFDRQSGKDMALQDVFPDQKTVKSALAPFIRNGVGDSGKELAEDDLDIEMKRIMLTPEGMRIIYAPYEIASYSEGEFIVDIPKKDLLKLGAMPEIWK
jgi:Protein of unknown function (DUF3298).